MLKAGRVREGLPQPRALSFAKHPLPEQLTHPPMKLRQTTLPRRDTHGRIWTIKIRSPTRPAVHTTRFEVRNAATIPCGRTILGAGWTCAPTVDHRSKTTA